MTGSTWFCGDLTPDTILGIGCTVVEFFQVYERQIFVALDCTETTQHHLCLQIRIFDLQRLRHKGEHTEEPEPKRASSCT